jgi:hypothetical protein
MATTILARRFLIICLTFALFAVGLWMIVDGHQRSARIGDFGLSACTQQGLSCHASI